MIKVSPCGILGPDVVPNSGDRMTIALNLGREYPSIQEISLVVAWSFAYAPKNAPLNESHPKWPEFFEQSEWFRREILILLELPPETKWEEIYRASGFLVEAAYETKEQSEAAKEFGRTMLLKHDEASRRFEELEELKFRYIVHRL